LQLLRWRRVAELRRIEEAWCCRGRLGRPLWGWRSPPASRRRPRSDRRTIQFWTLDLAPKFNGYIHGVIAAWERQNPGYRVVWTDVPWGSVERKLLAAVFARTATGRGEPQPPVRRQPGRQGGLLPWSGCCPPGPPGLPALDLAGRPQRRPDGRPAQFAIPWYLTARITLANTQLLQPGRFTAHRPAHGPSCPPTPKRCKRRTGRYALFVTVVPDDSAELLESLVQMDVTLLDGRAAGRLQQPGGPARLCLLDRLYRRGLLPREVVSQGYRRAIELYRER
jgi:putative chitobiose transport system substrate-binding protein